LASTVSCCRSALATRAQIRDLRIDSRGSLLWSASVTDNFGNRDNLRAGERRSNRKSGRSPILWGRRDTQAVLISSVTEVIEVIGYQPWRGVFWPYLVGVPESTATSTQRAGSRGTPGRPIKMMSLHWGSAGYLFARTMVLAHIHEGPELRAAEEGPPRGWV
jgi:hypothetical protein